MADAAHEPEPQAAGISTVETTYVDAVSGADISADPTADLTAKISSDASPAADLTTITDWTDRTMARMVPLAPATLGATMACLALAHLSSVDNLMGAYLSMASGTAGLGVSVCSLLWRRHRLGRRSVHAIMSACLVLGSADTLVYARITQSLERTGDLMLLVVACGLVLLDRRWYRATLAVMIAGWVWVALNAGPARPYQVVAMALALALGTRVRRSRIIGVEEVQELQATAALAMMDPLTGLPDRRGVQLVAAHLLAIARRESGAVGCTFVRIDGFDRVVKDAGTPAANDLLVFVAGVMKSVVRGTDVVARWSPSEFVVVTHGQGAPMDVLEDRIARQLAGDCPVEEAVWPRRLLLGRAVLEPWDDGGLVSTLETAEADMYRRAGQEPPTTSADGLAEAAAAQRRRTQAATGQAVSEIVAGAHSVLSAAAERDLPHPTAAATTDDVTSEAPPEAGPDAPPPGSLEHPDGESPAQG